MPAETPATDSGSRAAKPPFRPHYTIYHPVVQVFIVVRRECSDVITSVGYRVKSKRGTHFRTWATRILRDHAMKSLSIDDQWLKDLRQRLKLALRLDPDISDIARTVFRVTVSYYAALDVFDDYDRQQARNADVRPTDATCSEYDRAVGIIAQLRKQFGDHIPSVIEGQGSMQRNL